METKLTLEQAQARIAELEARIAELEAPKVSNRKKAPVVVVDGVTLTDRGSEATPMKRLVTASKRNLERVIPLRLKVMKLGGKPWRFVEGQGIAPMIQVDLGDEQTCDLDIYAREGGDSTDYYLVLQG